MHIRSPKSIQPTAHIQSFLGTEIGIAEYFKTWDWTGYQT